jgi:hypothetical protein
VPARTASAKRHPGRKRRLGGWTLVVLGVLIALTWGASGPVTVIWDAGLWCARIEEGRLIVQVSAESPPRVSWTKFGPGWVVTEAPGGGWHVQMRAVSPGFRGAAFRAQPDTCVDLWVVGYTRITSICTLHASLWAMALALSGSGGLLLRSGATARWLAAKDHCSGCGYSLTGLVRGAPCPECGAGSPLARTSLTGTRRRTE